MESEKITIITGRPANGKTTVGHLMQENFGFVCIEGDNFITHTGKIRLNNGTWNDIDRKIYLSRMAAAATEAKLENSDVVIADCLTTRWMREFLIRQITLLNSQLAVGFILLERELTGEQITQIATQRANQGHALEIDALIKFRQAFEPWDNHIPCVRITNPGDGDLNKLLVLAEKAFKKLWKQ